MPDAADIPRTRPEDRSTAALLTDALGHVSSLFRKEMDLARAEIDQNVKRAGMAIGMIVVAVVLLLVALNVLAAAAVAALTAAGLHAGWAAVIVGGGVALVAIIMVAIAMNNLKATSLAPTRTVENVRRDARAVTGD